MNICLIDSLSSAIEISKNLLLMPERNHPQEKTLYMALGFICLCKKFFDIDTNRQELEIMQKWQVNDGQDRELFLAKKKDKHYLYGTFIDLGAKALGIFIPDEDLPSVQTLTNKEISNYYKKMAM